MDLVIFTKTVLGIFPFICEVRKHMTMSVFNEFYLLSCRFGSMFKSFFGASSIIVVAFSKLVYKFIINRRVKISHFHGSAVDLELIKTYNRMIFRILFWIRFRCSYRILFIMNDMQEAQWFILIAGFMMVWMIMVMMV